MTNVVVSTPDGKPPFDLLVESPTVLSDLSRPTTFSMRATAKAPVLVVFNDEVFTASLHDAGTLDVIGPGCPPGYRNAANPSCSADPLMIPIGVTYGELDGPKPTGSVIDSTAITLVLVTDRLRSGTYHLTATGIWRLATDNTFAPDPVTVVVDFTVTGPA